MSDINFEWAFHVYFLDLFPQFISKLDSKHMFCHYVSLCKMNSNTVKFYSYFKKQMWQKKS